MNCDGGSLLGAQPVNRRVVKTIELVKGIALSKFISLVKRIVKRVWTARVCRRILAGGPGDRGQCMVLHVLRALFILLMAAVGWFYVGLSWLTVAISLSLGVLFICIDILSPRKKLAIFSGTFFGLGVGITIAYALSLIVHLILDQDIAPSHIRRDALEHFINLVLAFVCVYLAVSFILQTKDDFRFIIPYVEFAKKTKGPQPILLDTSALIDGRISDIAATGILDTQLVVPRFVLLELQAVADSGDKLKRNRGKRGLDVLAKLRNSTCAEVILYDQHSRNESDNGVDERLMELAHELHARVLTNDYNLNKIAQLRGVDVININDLSNALKPVVLPGEKMAVRLVKVGEGAGQGVGYLEDGTMVVVEQGRGHVNEEVEFTVTSALQTSAGRMIFGRMVNGRSAAGNASAGN
jgi:uncharacterized protein YacL